MSLYQKKFRSFRLIHWSSFAQDDSPAPTPVAWSRICSPTQLARSTAKPQIWKGVSCRLTHEFIFICLYFTSSSGRAGGGSFKRKKYYIARKEFAYRMCAKWPTTAMSKLFFWVWTKFLPLHGCDVMRFGVMCLWFDLLSSDVASCEVICGTTPVLLCTTKNYASTTLYYPVLQRTTVYYSSTTPVLLCTTQYYSSTTLYYASTTLYYTVLLQYYSLLQSTTPVLLCTTKYYSSTTPVLQSTTPVLLCTTKYYSSTTLYYKELRQHNNVLRQYYKVLLQYYSSTTKYYASTTCTTKYYSSTTLYYKVLRQYYSVLQSTTPVLLWLQSTTPVYSVLQSTTPVLLCTTKYYSVLHSTTPVLLCTTQYYNVLLCTTTPATLYKVPLQYYSVLQSTTPVLLCTTPVLQRTTQVLLSKVISNARRNKSHRPTSPNTAPATQNECHQWVASHMKRHFQCVEQVKSPSNLTKYCACREILKLKISAETPWSASANRKTIRG